MAGLADLVSHKQDRLKRPVLITIVAGLSLGSLLLGFVGGLTWGRAALAAQFSATQANAMLAYMPIGIIASLGIWRMKRWGLYLYAAFSVIGYAVNFAIGLEAGIAGYVSTMAVLGVAGLYFGRMS